MNLAEEVFAQRHSTGNTPVDVLSNFEFPFTNLGDLTNKITPIFFFVATMMVAFYFLIGAFELITSQGDKAHIVSARSKIYHAVIGLILLLLLFFVVQYVFDVFQLTGFNII